MGPTRRAQFNLPDDPDPATTAAVPSQETTLRETTQSVAEQTRARPAETEAEGAPGAKNTNSSVSSSDGQNRDDLWDHHNISSKGTPLSVLKTRLEKIHNLFKCVERGTHGRVRGYNHVRCNCLGTSKTPCENHKSPRRSHQSRATHRHDYQTPDRTLGARRL